MAFEIDVLIIFADRDDEPIRNSETGWVMQFKEFLTVILSQILGEKPNIMLKGEYDTMTSPNLDNIGVLITVLSNDFVQSRHCIDHLESFSTILESTPYLCQRIFKVFKSPLAVQEQPSRLREMFGYEMYQLDSDSGEVHEYADYFSTDAERQYWMEMVDLSYNITQTLTTLKTGVSPTGIKNIFNKKIIYLAETAHDLTVQRNIIARELQRLGYAILPQQTLPGNLIDLEPLVRQCLSESSMSIHLIGNAYGEMPQGSDRSLQEIQDRLAAERSIEAKKNQEDFTRLVWISPNQDHTNDRQKKFIETLKRDVEAQEGTEILQTLLEDFKNIVREELEDASEKKVLEETDGRAVYFMHDQADHKDVKPFIDLIKSSGFNILMPAFEGELLELRQKHIENLRNLDAAIIFKGKVNEQWVRMKALDLLKAPGFGRKKPIIGKAIVSASGSIGDKEPFRNMDIRVIDGDQRHSLESLRSYLAEFKP